MLKKVILTLLTGVLAPQWIDMLTPDGALPDNKTIPQRLGAPGQAWAIGKSGKEAALKLCEGTQWVRTPPGKG